MEANPNFNAQLTDALRFLDTVKQRFVYATPARPHVYTQFLDAMSEFQRGEVDREMLMDRVRVLFAEQPDLIEEFEGWNIPAAQAQ